MKKQIIIAMAIVLTGIGCQQDAAEDAPEPIVLDTVEKKVSYVIGYNTARQLQTEGFELDSEVVSAAITDLNSGNESLLSEEEILATMKTFQTQIQEKRQQEFNMQAESNLKTGQEFLAENAKRDGVVTTESGLQYEILTAGNGAAPKPTDRVSVNYKGSLIDGNIFDQGEGVEFTVNQLIPGWVEALPLMKTGAKWKLFIPASLAYGSGGTNNIEPNSTLIFEMELLSIVGE